MKRLIITFPPQKKLIPILIRITIQVYIFYVHFILILHFICFTVLLLFKYFTALLNCALCLLVLWLPLFLKLYSCHFVLTQHVFWTAKKMQFTAIVSL